MKRWTVKSTSDPTKVYHITKATEYDWECTCPDFTLRHHVCKHIKGVQKAYDKQTAKSKPAPNGSQATTVQSDNRGPGKTGNPIPSGELRGSDLHDGNPTGIHQGTEPNGSAGHDSSSQSSETSVGTPNVEPVVSGPTEGSDPTPLDSNQEVRRADDGRKRAEAERKAKLKAIDDWECRKTKYSESMWNRLQELRAQAKAHPERAQILKLQALPLKNAIRIANQKTGEKSPFRTDEEKKNDEFAESVEKALF